LQGKKSKTETIKERAIYVYLPSEEMVKEWKELAGKTGTSLSKFVIGHVMNSLGKNEGSRDEIPEDVQEEIDSMREEMKKLQKENKMRKIVQERLEKDLQKYRLEPFAKKGFKGKRKYLYDLVEILKRRKYITNDDILDLLHVEPKETDTIQALLTQLESLEAFGIIEMTPKGWRWIG
jgi:uncharacterized membrane protein YheB (UPF0754 family)